MARFANYEPITGCECGKCTCDLGAKFAKIQEVDRLHRFLIGLDGGVYGAVRSDLLSLDHLSSLNRAYHNVVQEERLRGGSSSKPRDKRDVVMSFKIQADFKSKNKVDNQNKFCNHCHREGHDESTCFQIHGFREWWGDRPRGGRGSGCNGAGRGRGAMQQVQAHATTATPNVAAQTNLTLAQPSTRESSGLAELSSTQWQNLLEILNALKKSSDRLHGKNTLTH